MLDWISKNVGGPSMVVFVGALISAAGAYWGSRQRAHSDKDLAALISGGDSFCYMYIARNEPSPDGPLYGFTPVGEFPLYDVGVRIVDRDKVIEHPTTFEQFVKGDTNLSLPTMAPGQNVLNGRWKMPDRKEVRYNIFFSARNGYFTQVLRLRRVEGIWESATRVRRGPYNDGPIIYEHVWPRYLRDPTEEIEWDEK